MLFILVAVDAPPGLAIGIKEDLAMHLEFFGDSKVLHVWEELPEQMALDLGDAT